MNQRVASFGAARFHFRLRRRAASLPIRATMSENGESRASAAASLGGMIGTTVSALPDIQTCEQARLSRDPRFDGLFFTAVSSTGIYCRPVCPAPPPKPQHVSYYRNAASAEAAGFRPCLRCRPELAPGDGSWRRGDALLARALGLIESGLLSERSVALLAERVGVGERQLRRVFVERLGAAPLAVHCTARLLFAKQLLSETTLSITDVAMAAGFGSLRRFNAVFQRAYRLPPSQLRQRPQRSAAQGVVLRLGYRPPYDFPALLGFLRVRALPGVESVGEGSYARSIDAAGSDAWLRASAWPGSAPALRLELHGVPASRMHSVVVNIRRMFDLDADPQVIAATLSDDVVLEPLCRANPGLRIPGGWDGFETAVRAVLGQQVSVAAARTLAVRLVEAFGQRRSISPEAGIDCLFPAPEALADADLSRIGLTRSRAETIRAVAHAVLDGRVDFSPGSTLDDFVARWVNVPGIGPWTAQYIALRALGHPDAFPSGDLVLRRTASTTEVALSDGELEKRAQTWRPWRGYAVMQLWRDASRRALIKGSKPQ